MHVHVHASVEYFWLSGEALGRCIPLKILESAFVGLCSSQFTTTTTVHAIAACFQIRHLQRPLQIVLMVVYLEWVGPFLAFSFARLFSLYFRYFNAYSRISIIFYILFVLSIFVLTLRSQVTIWPLHYVPF